MLVIAPPRYTQAELDAARLQAIAAFRTERLEEPVEQYHEFLDEYQGVVEDLLETTVDLTQLSDQALTVMGDPKLFHALRYLAGPPISKDDLQTLAEVSSFVPARLASNPAAVARIVGVIRDGIDRRRFAWVSDGREPDEHERKAAVLASAALIAAQRLQTLRRNDAQKAQELLVEEALLGVGWRKVPTREVPTLRNAPAGGEFCRESHLARRKADFIIGLHDGRVLALECKVSNSATNSVKRLNNDAAAKAGAWIEQLGSAQLVPAAVLSGVYKLHNLEAAQAQGLTIFWAHQLSALTAWVESARPIRRRG